MINNTANASAIDSPILDYLLDLRNRFSGLDSGEVADYIPELAKGRSDSFGISVATTEGDVYEVGDSRQEFTIQSISKPFVYGLALEDNGRTDILKKIGVEPTGDAFNSISLDPETGQPANPMINAGAIASAGQVMGHGFDKKINRIMDMMSAYAGRPLKIDEGVYQSESETGHRNRAIGYMLRNFNILEEDPTDTLELYFRQCSVSVNCHDLAIMGATLANAGINPLTQERAIRGEYVENVLSVMGSCGMYDYAGEWIYKVGMPAKSGVAGGIVAVLPGKLGIGVFSPPLDKRGNSVRGIEVCNRISMDFNLHMFNVVQPGKSVIRRSYDGSRMTSKHMRCASERRRLRDAAHRICVLEVQGDLNFSTTEVVMNAIVSKSQGADYFVVDLKRVLTLDQSTCRLFCQLLLKLADRDKSLVFANCDAYPELGRYVRRKLKGGNESLWLCFEDDYALEYCEEQILGIGNITGDPVSLETFELFDGLDADEIEVIGSRLTRQKYSQGETIINQGEPASQLYLLAQGQVSIKMALPDGNTKRLATLSQGLVFGEIAWIERSERSAAVTVDVDALCYKLDINDFDAMMVDHSPIKVKVLGNLLRLFSRNLRKANTEIGVLS
ncbi:MAG TPA: glutaminase A [Gammaproteobacteria bacterium]|nr:glutaminase A [Gammaproteobacteria bacterium]